MYLAPMTINMNNFKAKHRGKIVGITGASWWAGPASFALIRGTFFSRTQNIGGYFAFTAALFVVVNILAILLVKYYPEESEGNDSVQLELNGNVQAGESNTLMSPSLFETPGYGVAKTGIQLLRSVDFHLIAWSYLLLGSVQLMFINNVTVYLKSYNMQALTLPLTISGPLLASMSMFVSGAITDVFMLTVPRSVFLVVGDVIQTLLIAACISKGNNFALFVITTLVIYTNNGFCYGITPTLISEYFGMKYFSRNWGGLVLAYALLSWLFLAEYGYRYDNIRRIDQVSCYGHQCFQESYVIAATASFIGTLLTVVFAWREKTSIQTRYVIR